MYSYATYGKLPPSKESTPCRVLIWNAWFTHSPICPRRKDWVNLMKQVNMISSSICHNGHCNDIGNFTVCSGFHHSQTIPIDYANSLLPIWQYSPLFSAGSSFLVSKYFQTVQKKTKSPVCRELRKNSAGWAASAGTNELLMFQVKTPYQEIFPPQMPPPPADAARHTKFLQLFILFGSHSTTCWFLSPV